MLFRSVAIAGQEQKQDAETEVFEDGDFYLTHAEKAMVDAVKNSFPRVVVVMNVGGMVDTDWFAEEEKIQSVLMAWQGGIEGGLAAAELLIGEGNPSGKLSDTFAKKLEDYPSTYNFHESDDYVEYTDDIYVGYRYFETVPGAAEKVNYPFGFGLSYTKFSLSMPVVEKRTVSKGKFAALKVWLKRMHIVRILLCRLRRQMPL